jgi:hypothetical protein
MANRFEKRGVDLTESSVYNDSNQVNPVGAADDVATEATLDRLEAITGGADEPGVYEGELAREVDELDASTDEEVDALEVNLLQDDTADPLNGSGRIIDELAEEQMAGFTEVGPDLEDRGAISVVPGRDETSTLIRKHHPNTAATRAEDGVEDNLDEPREESRTERKVNEGTGL